MDEARALDADQVEIEASRLPPPVLTWVGGREFRLAEPYVYADVEGGRTITVPKDFVFDLSSIPRIFWGVLAPFELSIVAPLVHDFLYRHEGAPPNGAVTPTHRYSRAEADRLFLRGMEQEGVARWRRTVGWAAVRAFGSFAW